MILKKIFSQASVIRLMPISIVISALIFGAGHIPLFVHGVIPETPLLIFRIMILNLISGITFGTLFWKKGFETAVLAHFAADFIEYAIIPALCLFVF
jgi:membrane protease YdiL (CAAX protease family)